MAENIFPRVFIVLPVHNHIEETKCFLRSIDQQTYNNFVTIVCDDGSTDGTSKYIEEYYPNVILLSGDGNFWWTRGINRCVEYALDHCNKYDYILTINNDAFVSPDYIEQKIQRAKEYPNSIIGSLGLFMDNPELIETSAWIMDFAQCRGKSLTKPAEKRTEKHRGMIEVTYLPGKGVLFPVEVFRKIGIFDEHNFPQYHADTDLILRSYKANYKIYLDYDSIVYSKVNEKNMVLPHQIMTIRDIFKTFKGPYSISNFRIYNNFAKIHFPNNKLKFLTTTYIRTVGGLFLRYFRDRTRRITRDFPP